MPAASGQSIVIDNLTLDIDLGLSNGQATRIVVKGMTGPQGRAVTVKNINVAKTNREL